MRVRDPRERPIEDSVWAMLPKGSIFKIISLLLLLAAVIYFKNRPDGVARALGGFVGAPAPSRAPRVRASGRLAGRPDGALDNSVPSSPR